MSAKSTTGSAELGAKIKKRRNELGLTIEDAATKAGIGTKTWCRYEAGGSIRSDKVLNICKTLKWNVLPEQENDELFFDINEYKRQKTWSKFLAKAFGEVAAVSFIIGSDILLDNIEQDLEALSHKPKGTHIGELDFSCLEDCLPDQFLMNYNYDFLYCMRSVVLHYRNTAQNGGTFIAHTVLEEIVLYNIMEESEFLIEETIIPNLPARKAIEYSYWNEWAFDILGDMDIVTFLYDRDYLSQDDSYHFDHWLELQFYCE